MSACSTFPSPIRQSRSTATWFRAILSPKNGTFSYPADLIERHAPQVGSYRIAPDVQYKQGNEAAYIADIYDLIDAHGRWALHLMDNEPTDVLMVHFIALDLMMHALWRFMDASHPRHEPSEFEHAIRDGYKQVDGYIGQMMERLEAETPIVIMSDHGFGPLHRIVNLNNFLMQKGILKLNGAPLTRLKHFAFRSGISPATIYRLIERIGLQNIATRVSKGTRNQVLGRFLNYDNVDWSQTVAYSMGHVGQIYINLIGREPKGVVSAENYKQVRQQVVDALWTLTDENGKQLVTSIILREETYHGPHEADGPDIHVVLDDYRMIAYPLFATNNHIVTEQIRGDTGCHRSEGVLVVSGSEIHKGAKIEGSEIVDLAPTIFALLGEAVPDHLDGKVLADVFQTPPTIKTMHWGDSTLSQDEQLTQSERDQVEDRLRSLGYL